MNILAHALLAQQEPAVNPLAIFDGAVRRLDLLNHPQELMAALENLHIVWASILVVVGGLSLLNGYRWHRKVIIVCAFLGGLGLGHLLSQRMGQSRIAMAAIGLLCAVVATPLLRFAVAVFGGLTGAFLGANVWTAFSEAPDAHLAGAGMGFIALGLAAFIMFRLVIMLFTSIGGAAMVVLGTVTLLLHVPTFQQTVYDSLATHKLIIPLLVATAATTGFVLQHAEAHRREQEEEQAEAA